MRLRDSIIPAGIQKAFLFQFCGAELFGQLIASGYKNVRINAALLFEHGQKLILTGNG